MSIINTFRKIFLGAEVMAGIKYGILDEADWPLVNPIFEAFGGAASMPQPGLARIAVAIDQDDQIHGMLTLQLVPHMEPIWIKDESKAIIRFDKLVETHEKLMAPGCEYFAFAPNELVRQMAEKVGMVPRKEWEIMHKVVGRRT